MQVKFMGIHPQIQMTRKAMAFRAGGVLFGLAALLALAIIPTEILARGPIICVWRNLFGIECPTCGMTRAFSSILHGRLVQAFGYNKLVIVVFPTFCAFLFREAVWLVRRLYANIPRLSRG
jgi:hypothetical protein